MKYRILLVAILINLVSCSQNNSKKMEPSIKNTLTKNNYVETLLAEIKHYSKEPLYYMYIGNTLCVYEIYVNDFPVRKQYTYEQLANPIYINQEILKSGRQKISFKIYPAPPEFNIAGDVFSPNTSFNIRVQVQDYKDPKAGDNDSVVAKYNLPTKIRLAGTNNDIEIKEFEAEGQKYYEGSFYFDATVPYENEGWSNGQDLRKLDQQSLLQEVVAFYKKQWDIYDKKDINAMLSYLWKKETEVRQSIYCGEEELKNALRSYSKVFDSKQYEVQPLENYKLVFYGDGKIATLKQTSNDLRVKGESALWGLEGEVGKRRSYFHPRYLYLPNGNSLSDGLKVVR